MNNGVWKSVQDFFADRQTAQLCLKADFAEHDLIKIRAELHQRLEPGVRARFPIKILEECGAFALVIERPPLLM